MSQSDWFNEVLEHKPEGFDPYVESHYKTDEGLNYGSWDTYKGQVDFDERSVLPNEIVIDIDAEDTETARQQNKRVLNFLSSNGYGHFVGDTGGTGFHIHLFFEYSGLDLEDYREVRIALYKYLKAKCREEVDADTSLWDDQPVMFDVSNSKGHLVRAFGGRKTSSENRKTEVLNSRLNKKEVIKKDEVEYPARIPWAIEISKTGTDSKDLSIQEINEKVEEVKEEEKQRHKADVDASSLDTRVEGLEDARDIPASKVLDMLGIEYKKRQNFECPFHDDSDPSANIHEQDGIERLYCFSDSCSENGRAKAFNAIDIMEESGYSFNEALEKFNDAFEVDIVIGYNPHDYFSKSVKDNYVIQPERLAEEIMEEYRFKNVVDGSFYVWLNGYWKEVADDDDIIGTEVDKRLKNETKPQYRRNVREIIKNRESIKIEKEDFEHAERMIPFSNGCYDLEEDELKEPRPEYNFTFKYEAAYRPELENDDVERFLRTIQPEDSIRRQKLREVAACAIAPFDINQVVPILHGQGSNGKNQFVKIPQKILGRDQFHKSSAMSIADDQFEMASIADSQLTFFDEFEDTKETAQLKELIGEETQRIRQAYQGSETVKMTSYFFFAANTLPEPKDESDGFYRRWEIIDFDQKFTAEENDGNPNKISRSQLEERYMNQDALDSFATSLVDEIQDLLDRNGQLTEEQTEDEVREIWKKKGNPLYSFIDKFLIPGNQPDKEKNKMDVEGPTTDHWMKKGELLEIVNEYMDLHNHSPITKNHLTRALGSYPDLDIVSNYRPRLEDSRPRAYAGIKLNPQESRNIQRYFGATNYISPPLNETVELGKWTQVVDKSKLAEVLIHLTKNNGNPLSLCKLIKSCDLSDTEVHMVRNSDFIRTESRENDGVEYPVFKLDESTLEEHDIEIDFTAGMIESTQSFVEDLIRENWGDQEVDYADIIGKAEDEGYSEEEIKHGIDELLNDGTLYEPKPGKVKIL